MRDAGLAVLTGVSAALTHGLLVSLHAWGKHKVWRYQMLLSYIPFVNWKGTEHLEEVRARRVQRRT